MMKSQISDIEKNNLIEEGKKQRIDEIIRTMVSCSNGIIVVMVSCCLKCKKKYRKNKFKSFKN